MDRMYQQHFHAVTEYIRIFLIFIISYGLVFLCGLGKATVILVRISLPHPSVRWFFLPPVIIKTVMVVSIFFTRKRVHNTRPSFHRGSRATLVPMGIVLSYFTLLRYTIYAGSSLVKGRNGSGAAFQWCCHFVFTTR